jgi:hypothetical protein
MRFHWLAACLVLVGGTLLAQDAPEVTEEGLVRVPSTPKAAVYRDPDVPFSRYQRIELGQITVKFRKGWERNHREVKQDDLEKIRGELARAFRTEIYQELIKQGGYELAQSATPDTLRLEASILDLDITAPEASTGQRQKTYVRTAGSMKLVIELRDAASGVLIGRIVDFEHAREYDRPQLASQVSNAEEFRIGFEKAARYTREALNVAKTEKPK